MTAFPLGRVAVAAVTLLLLSVSAAQAKDWLCHRGLCGHKECRQRVVLPAREIDIVTEQPRVTVREAATREVASRVRSRSVDVGLAPIGTVYLPLTVPTLGMGFQTLTGVEPAARSRDIDFDDFSALDAVHRAERHAARALRIQTELEHAMDANKRVMERLATRSTRAADPASTSVLEQKMTLLQAEIEKLNKRVESVEKLLIYHDNWIQKQVPGREMIPPVTGTGGTSGTRAAEGGVTQTQPSTGGPMMIPPVPTPTTTPKN